MVDESYDSKGYRKVEDLGDEEFKVMGDILNYGKRERILWQHYNGDKRHEEGEFRFTTSRNMKDPKDFKEIILKFDGTLILPKGTSYEKWFVVESYLADLGLERKLFTDGKLEKILSVIGKTNKLITQSF